MSLSSAGELLPISGTVDVDSTCYARSANRVSFEPLRGADEACLLVDGLGLIRDCNKAAAALFSEDSEPLEGGCASALIARYDELLFLSALQQTIYSGYSDTLVIHTHDDRRVEVSLHQVSSDKGHGPCCLMTIAVQREAAEEQAPVTLDAGALIKLELTNSGCLSPAITWLPLNGAA